MRPYVFSVKKFEKFGIKWAQDGSDLSFQAAKLRYSFVYDKTRVRQYWRLSFSLEFEYPDDLLYVAYCVPYTYSQLLHDLDEIEAETKDMGILQRSTNGKTLMGLDIPVLSITNPEYQNKNKKVVLMCGRVHPGQSNGSIVLLGTLRYLCSREADQLRKNTIFVVIPMMNPDGVIVGNNRTGVMGKDLNRQYMTNNKQLYPEICNIKKLVLNLQKKYIIHMFLDYHGHSQKKNTFTYGPSYNISQPGYLKSKVFPKLLSHKTQMFRYYSCIFKITDNKRSTGRAVMFQQLHIPYTYTIQSSIGFYYNPQTLVTHQFTQAKWLEMGKAIGQCLSDYVIHLKQYQSFIAERRLQRLKRKGIIIKVEQNIIVRKKKIIAMESHEQDKPIPQTVYFVDIIQQIKQQQLQSKNELPEDGDLDSDSGDEKEDADPNKLQIVSTLIEKTNNEDKGLFAVRGLVVRQKGEEKKKIRDKPKSIPITTREYEGPDVMETELDIINEIIEPKLKKQKNEVKQSPEKSIPEHKIDTVSSKKLRLMKKTFHGKMQQKRRSQMRMTAQEVYSPVTKPYVIPLTQHVKQSNHFSIRKKIQRSDTSRNSGRGKSIDDQDLHSLTIETQLMSERMNYVRQLKTNFSKLLEKPKNEEYEEDPTHSKTILPVSFYRMKQQIQNKKKMNSGRSHSNQAQKGRSLTLYLGGRI